jgi:long-chain acyl-CoA synthetase
MLFVKDWSFIINDSAASVVFCSTKDIFSRLNKEVLQMTPHVHTALCLDAVDSESYGYNAAVKGISQYSNADFDVVETAPTEDDLANLIYTSGTTGKHHTKF